MYKKLLLLITLFLFHFNCNAAENAKKISIPYMTYEYKAVTLPTEYGFSEKEVDEARNKADSSELYYNSDMFVKDKIVASNKEKVPRLINLTRKQLEEIKTAGDSMCEVLGGSDVKVWFTLDSKGKFVIAEFMMGAGIEVTFHCNS